MVALDATRGGAGEERMTTSTSECRASRRRSAGRHGGGGGVSLSAVAFLAVAACLVGGGVEAVSNGGQHSCSVFDDGTVKCWGANGSGQLGVGDLSARGSLPEHMGDDLPDVNLGTGFVASGVSCGLDHSCTWDVGGKVKCWGGNTYGQLGLEDTANRGGTALTMGDNLPFLDLGPGEAVQKVVAANHFTCVLLMDETVKCFGRNDWGQLGSGNKANNVGDATGEMGDELPRVELVPTGANATVSVLAAHNGPCVIMQSDVAASPAVKCWGPNGYGSLGAGDSYNRGDDPGEMGGYLGAANLGTNVAPIDLVTGMDYVCALTSAGGVKCWGRNCNGQGGFGDIETYGDDPDEMGDNLPFVDLGTGRTAVSLTAGDAHTCALLDNGAVKCWGKGYFGQTGLERWHSMGQAAGQMGDDLPALDLGTSSAPASSRRALRGLQAAAATPVAVESISAGGQRSCAIVDGGSVKCWGNAFAGALGLGDETDRGGRAGQMGDSLPTLSLGAGKVAVTPAPVMGQTPAPTPAPTAPATAPATPGPTSLSDVQVPATPAPTLAPTPQPTLAPTPAPTPAPTLAPTVAERGGFEGLADDVGVSVTQGIAIAAGVPLIALFACCFCGLCIARKKNKERNDELEPEVIAAANGGSRKGPDGRAATIAPASAVGSRIGSRSNSRAGSWIGSRVEERRADALLADKNVNVFYAEGVKNGAKPGHAQTGSVENDGSWFAASHRTVSGEEEEADDAEKRLSSANIGNVLGKASGKGEGLKEVTPKKLKHTASSSETPPPNTWGNYEIQPIDESGSFTPESNAGGSVLSRGHSRSASATHSRNASGARPVMAAMAGSPVAETEVSTAAVHADPHGAPAPSS